MLVLALAALICGCSVNKDLVPTGGSRADGTVDLSFSIGEFQQAQIDWVKADGSARERCAAWGYTSANRFGGEKRQCAQWSQYGCSFWNVTVTYQCTGGGPS